MSDRGVMNTYTSDVVDLESPDDLALADRMKTGRQQILAELRKIIVGQEEVISQVLNTLFVGGNSLIVGAPGLAKTLLIHTMARVLDLKFSRIQFTPDLMPSDITGTDLVQEDATTGRRQMVFAPGPIFANIVSLGAVGGDNLPSDPKLRALYLERRDLERRVESLRLLKESMEPGRYSSELEKLVTTIALKTREIRTAEGK